MRYIPELKVLNEEYKVRRQEELYKGFNKLHGDKKSEQYLYLQIITHTLRSM